MARSPDQGVKRYGCGRCRPPKGGRGRGHKSGTPGAAQDALRSGCYAAGPQRKKPKYAVGGEGGSGALAPPELAQKLGGDADVGGDLLLGEAGDEGGILEAKLLVALTGAEAEVVDEALAAGH